MFSQVVLFGQTCMMALFQCRPCEALGFGVQKGGYDCVVGDIYSVRTANR